MEKIQLKSMLEKIYLQARSNFQDWFGACPEEYRVLLFIDPKLQPSIERMIRYAGTPRGTLGASHLRDLREMREKGYFPETGYSVFNSIPTQIYTTVDNGGVNLSGEKKFVLHVHLYQALLYAYFNEKTKSNSPHKLTEIYQHDIIIRELMNNNVAVLKKKLYAPWSWQYFQDLTSVVQLLTLFQVDFFYKPPEGVRDRTIINNYLLEIVEYVKERAKLVRSKHLIELVQQGFVHYFTMKLIDELIEAEEYGVSEIPKECKPLFFSVASHAGYAILVEYLQELEQDEKVWLDSIFSFQCDSELVQKMEWRKLKKILENAKEGHYELQGKMHAGLDQTYWLDIWSLYTQEWRIMEKHVRTLSLKGIRRYGQIIDESENIQYLGYITAEEKQIYVFQIDETGWNLEQLVILHHHLTAMRDTFKTPLPAFADIIVFRKMKGMHVATFLNVQSDGRPPKSPWDIPSTTRAVQVLRKKNAYKSERSQKDNDEEKDKEQRQIDYSNIHKMTQPQRAAIRYLITKGTY